MGEVAGGEVGGFFGETPVDAFAVVGYQFAAIVGYFATPHPPVFLQAVPFYFVFSRLELVGDCIEFGVSVKK
jgi:hypothetical protein